MPVFRSNKIVHIHVPRTGGTSVNEAFFAIGDFPYKQLPREPDFMNLYGLDKRGSRTVELDHLTYEMMRQYVSPALLTTFRKIAVVRNPMSRFLSEYRRQVERNDRRLFSDIADLSIDDYALRVLSLFESGRVFELSHFSRSHIMPQFEYIRDGFGIAKGLKLIRFENLSEESVSVFSELNVPIEFLPRTNVTASLSRSGEVSTGGYSDIVRETVVRTYGCDYLHLGYELPTP